MPYYSDELIEEVRSRNDIVDVIGSYVRLKKKGSTYFGLCPFHNEKTGSFSVSPNKQMYGYFPAFGKLSESEGSSTHSDDTKEAGGKV